MVELPGRAAEIFVNLDRTRVWLVVLALVKGSMFSCSICRVGLNLPLSVLPGNRCAFALAMTGERGGEVRLVNAEPEVDADADAFDDTTDTLLGRGLSTVVAARLHELGDRVSVPTLAVVLLPGTLSPTAEFGRLVGNGDVIEVTAGRAFTGERGLIGERGRAGSFCRALELVWAMLFTFARMTTGDDVPEGVDGAVLVLATPSVRTKS
jgi:hypothetical protein